MTSVILSFDTVVITKKKTSRDRGFHCANNMPKFISLISLCFFIIAVIVDLASSQSSQKIEKSFSAPELPRFARSPRRHHNSDDGHRDHHSGHHDRDRHHGHHGDSGQHRGRFVRSADLDLRFADHHRHPSPHYLNPHDYYHGSNWGGFGSGPDDYRYPHDQRYEEFPPFNHGRGERYEHNSNGGINHQPPHIQPIHNDQKSHSESSSQSGSVSTPFGSGSYSSSSSSSKSQSNSGFERGLFK